MEGKLFEKNMSLSEMDAVLEHFLTKESSYYIWIMEQTIVMRKVSMHPFHLSGTRSSRRLQSVRLSGIIRCRESL